MYALSNLWNASPARIVALVLAVVAILAIYGLNVVPDTEKFATALGTILTVLAGGEITRANVYSPTTVRRLTGGRV